MLFLIHLSDCLSNWLYTTPILPLSFDIMFKPSMLLYVLYVFQWANSSRWHQECWPCGYDSVCLTSLAFILSVFCFSWQNKILWCSRWSVWSPLSSCSCQCDNCSVLQYRNLHGHTQWPFSIFQDQIVLKANEHCNLLMCSLCFVS